MSFKVLAATTSAAVATSGTINFAYPANTSAGDFASYGHTMFADGLQALFTQDDGDISVAPGASNIVVTYKGSTSIPANTAVTLQANIVGNDEKENTANLSNQDGMNFCPVIHLSLGSPDVADPNGVCESQAGTAATAMTIDGALASGGVATFDVPRNIVGAWTTSATVTVTGTDQYGNTIVESDTGTTYTGTKAFKTVTSVVPSANITGATIGTGDVFGLPVFLPNAVFVLAELEDGAAASSGTLVAGVQTTPTATTGDVRGTYDPDSAADGSTAFSLLVALPDPTYKGVDQYGG